MTEKLCNNNLFISNYPESENIQPLFRLNVGRFATRPLVMSQRALTTLICELQHYLAKCPCVSLHAEAPTKIYYWLELFSQDAANRGLNIIFSGG